MRSELSCWQMLLRFSDLFFQKSSSVKGSGWPPDLRAFSGSYLSTFLICFYQWIMAAKFELKKAVTNFQECVPCLWTKCARLRSHLMVEVVGECDPLPGQWSHRCRQGISETCP